MGLASLERGTPSGVRRDMASGRGEGGGTSTWRNETRGGRGGGGDWGSESTLKL